MKAIIVNIPIGFFRKLYKLLRSSFENFDLTITITVAFNSKVQNVRDFKLCKKRSFCVISFIEAFNAL